jgi:hypothetical protein
MFFKSSVAAGQLVVKISKGEMGLANSPKHQRTGSSVTISTSKKPLRVRRHDSRTKGQEIKNKANKKLKITLAKKTEF